MLKTLQEIRFARAFFRLAQDPTRTEEVFRLSNIGMHMDTSEAVRIAVGRAVRSKGFLDLFHERYQAPPADFKKLARLPDNTLGKQYELHMTRNGLKPDFFWPTSRADEAQYLIHRGREVHDIWHVLTGYDTTFEEEIALQAFTLSQLESAISNVIMAAGLMHAVLFKPSKMLDLIELIDEGRRRGAASEYLMGVAWEKHWEMPLEEARAWMKIPPRKEAGSLLYGSHERSSGNHPERSARA
jgi:ubiquinone biosynthesis protein Coq4